LHLGDLPYGAALFFEKIMDELQNKSVLVVDDNPGMLRAMSKVLAGEGMQVTGVSDPVAVVKKLADSEKRFDVVITDLRMPMFSGRGVLALASALPELPVTSRHLAGLMSKLRRCAWVPSPFSRSLLLLPN
jgi:CheY-like chemotaxis protein